MSGGAPGLWDACQGPQHVQPIGGTLFRLVESQEQIATLDYVDTLEEQAVLESLLDAAKPPYPAGGARHHYLLRTPFRYPPLPWGSRFGARDAPSLLYGGLSQDVTLCEAAFYRFVFWASMAAPAPGPTLLSQHSLFTVPYKTRQGVRLQEAPFDRFRARLCDPADYGATQALGAAMRAAGVEAFEYASARDPQQRPCVALFGPQALAAMRPRSLAMWLCELSAERVVFRQASGAGPAAGTATRAFHREDFCVHGQLPLPA